MATATVDDGPDFVSISFDAVFAGIAAGVVFGLLIQTVLARMGAIGAMYTLGDASVSVGWVAHMGHSLIFALLYGVVTQSETLRGYAGSPITGAGLGASFGFVLWFVNIGFVWPLWLGAVGFVDLPVPYHLQAIQPLMGHLLWGTLLGALFPLVGKRHG